MNERVKKSITEIEKIAEARLFTKLFRYFFTKKELKRIFAIFNVKTKEFTKISASVETLLGYRPEEMIGRNYEKFLMFDGDIRRGEDTIQANIEGEDVAGFINSYQHRNGAEVYLTWDVSFVEEDKCICIAALASRDQILKIQKIRMDENNQKENQKIKTHNGESQPQSESKNKSDL